MSYETKRWYTARCGCVKPILYQERDRYPLRCARCGGHLYTAPRPPHFERMPRTPIANMRSVLRLLGLGVLALLGWLLVALAFIVFGGQP